MHQHQMRNQRLALPSTGTVSTTTTNSANPLFPRLSSPQNNSSSPLATANSFLSSSAIDKLVHPNPTIVSSCVRDTMPMGSDQQHDLDVSEEDLKDLLSQKDLATTLAENLLKHFGSDDIDIKDSGKFTTRK